MTPVTLTSSQQIIRRALVAACVIFSLGVAGTVVGQAASREDARPAVAAAVPAVEVVAAAGEVNVELASAKIAPETPVNGRELLRDQTAEARVQVTPAPAPAVVLAKLRTIEMEVTAYCPCTKCCGPNAQGITASGKLVSHNEGRFVAADRKFAFGTKLIIPGYAGGTTVEVLDRGGAIKGNKLDVYYPTHAEALKWGRQKLTVTVVE
jgi:3D (Asp-Asp-Asp) domain-containing protein